MNSSRADSGKHWERVLLLAICLPLAIALVVLACTPSGKNSPEPENVEGEVTLTADVVLKLEVGATSIPPLVISCEDAEDFCKKALALQKKFSKKEGMSTLIGCTTFLLKGTIASQEINLRGDCNDSTHQAMPFFRESIPKYFPQWEGTELLLNEVKQ